MALGPKATTWPGGLWPESGQMRHRRKPASARAGRQRLPRQRSRRIQEFGSISPGGCVVASHRSRIARATACVLLAACGGGCTLGPDYARPDVPIPDGYRYSVATEGAIATADPSLAEVEPWWEGFHDPQLDALVREGLAANSNIKVAIARVNEFQARLESTDGQQINI